MRVGELRRQVTIQAEAPSADAGGGYALAWISVATVWASITPLSGTERFNDAGLQSQVSHRVRIRYLADVTADMRILYGTRLFNIHAVLNTDESNRWLDLLVEEGVAV